MKQFQRAYLRPLPGVNVLTSLYLVNLIQNYIPPHQNLVDPPLQTNIVDLTFSFKNVAY